MQVDKVALDALHDDAEVHLQNLEPWIQVGHLYTLSHVWVQQLILGR